MTSCDGTYRYCPCCKLETLSVEEEFQGSICVSCIECDHLFEAIYDYEQQEDDAEWFGGLDWSGA